MIVVHFAAVTLVLGARTLFKALTWEIQEGQRIGLIGPNGAGKSSLLKLVMGEYQPEPGGAVVRAKGVTVGYLAQEPALDPAQTALAAALEGNPRIAELEAELAECERRLADPAVYGSEKALTRMIERQQAAVEAYDALGGASYAARVETLLTGLGLPAQEFVKPLAVLSGGQRKLVGLARLLLAQPRVLLLDEPDNHLDLAGKTFLEGLIREYPGAVVLVSHDRYLLDAVATHIAELEDGRLTMVAGDYTSYILDKEARLARAEELYQVQQRQIARLEMARRRYAVWVQMNDKFASRLHAIEARLTRVERLDRPVLERKRMELALNGWRGSNKVLEVVNVQKRFGAQAVLRGVELLVRHGERVGLIGENGAGKSVFLQSVLGTLAPDTGEVRLGPSVVLGYYAQHHETLDPEQTLIDAVRQARPLSESAAVSLLNRYLFGYRQATQVIGTLSGGERSRLQLALIVLSGANFLLLDEPTNNLDIAAAEVLEEALAEFEGSVLMISHDRYFLERVATRVVALEDGRLREYADYDAYAAAHG